MWKSLLLIFAVFLVGCNQQPGNDQDPNVENPTSNDDVSDGDNKSGNADIPPATILGRITIDGDYVRVRDKPDTKGSEVKFRLMKGDQCSVLEKGPKGTVEAVQDNWYRIDCSSRTGWVWGGLTSMRSGQGNTGFFEVDNANIENPDSLSKEEEMASKFSQDENAFIIDIDLAVKMSKSLSDFYLKCQKQPQCKITKKQEKNAFDLDNTVTIASVLFKSSVINFVEDETWPFNSKIVDNEITLGPGIKVGMNTADLEKIVGKPVKARIFRIQGENDEFYLWIKNDKVSKIEYEGYTG